MINGHSHPRTRTQGQVMIAYRIADRRGVEPTHAGNLDEHIAA